jgi:outer membrane cobalamin receptor
MTRISTRALAIAAALTVSAAAHAAAQEPAPADTTKPVPAVQDTQKAAPQPARRPARRDRNLITREEIEEVQAIDARQLIQRVRPAWLRPRGTSTVPVQVYRDGMKLGGAATLATIPISQIRSLRYYDAMEGAQRFGPENMAGVIEILTR